jgi:hypothetical protein
MMVGSSCADDLAQELRQELLKSRAVASQAAAKLRTGTSIAAEVTSLKSNAGKVRASHLLMQERFRLRSDQAATLGTKAVERHSAVADTYGSALDDYLALIDALPPDGSVSQTNLDDLKAILDRIVPAQKRPLLGTLPYHHPGYPAWEPATAPVVVPAYRGGNRAVTPADTAASVEAPHSAEIASLARSLQWHPVLIYEWVKNNVETEWYRGVMKGAEETLRQRSGNDADQAALLIALLRASGFPARFVTGTIEFFPDIHKVKNLTGINDPMSIAAFFRKAGIPFTPVIAGGGIGNFRVEHIWVEAYIPYAHYRGAIIDDSGKSWLGLDTSIKPLGYTRGTPMAVPHTVTASLRDDYLQGLQEKTPLEFLQAKIEAYLAENHPGKVWHDVLASRTLNPDVLSIIPGSLQFNQIAITGEYTELPPELRHRMTFTATSGQDELYSLTLETHALSNRRVTLTYEPETVEDQQIIDGYGGLDSTPSYLVRLRPVLKVAGERMIVARDGLAMGAEYTLTIDVVTPNGTETTTSTQIAGNLSVIGIVAGLAAAPAPLTDTDDAEAVLFKEAMSHIDRWSRAEEELAAFHQVAIARPVATVVTVGGLIDVAWLLDAPHDFQWRGVFIDAALRGIEIVSQNGDASQEQGFMRLSALQGSVLENRLFEDDLKVESISTAKVLQLAATHNVPLVTIDRSTVDALLPTLPCDDAVKQDIVNAVNRDLVVTVPAAEMAYQDWRGIGYVKEDPKTGEAGWMLSGMVAGGMTAQNKAQWVNASLANMMSLPNSVPANKDPFAVTSLKRVTDHLAGIAGEMVTQPLMVMALDDKNRRVQNVPVTFKAIAGGGTLQGVSMNGLTITKPGAEIIVKTETDGVARANLTLGAQTAAAPYYVHAVPNDILVGQNLVSASTTKGNTVIRTDKTMEALGYPGATVNLVKVAPGQTDNLWGQVNTYSGPVWVKPADKRGNPVSNKKVTFTAAQPLSLATPPLPVDLNVLFFRNGSACPGIPTRSCPNTSASLQKDSDGSGAYAGVILGNTDNTHYPIIAAVTGDTVDANMVRRETDTELSIPFAHYSLQVPGGTTRAGLSVLGIEHLDENGQRIDAGQAGVPMKTPLETMLFLHEEVDKSKGAFATKQVTDGKVDYFPGSGSVAPQSVTAGAGGTYKTTLTPGVIPGLNKIVAQATATVLLASGETITLTDATTLRIWGVKPEVPPNQEIYVNRYGYPEVDTRLEFTMNPPEYTAYSRYLLIYEDGEYMGFIPAGNGQALLSQGGAKFDIRKKYTAQLVLNWMSAQEIRSPAVPLNVTMLCLIPDYDHNRKIDYADRARALNKDKYYFWVNDDDGKGDTEGTGIPGTRDPATIGVVNGTRDLVDYFPVQIDISGLPSDITSGAYTYRLKNADGAFSLVLPWLAAAESGNYLTDIATAQLLANAPSLPITADGLILDAVHRQALTGGKDVLLLEAWKATQKPLVLEIADSRGRVVYTSSLNLSMAGVEQMFRHKNLIQTTGGPAPDSGDGGAKNRLSEPPNFPDTETIQKNFIFLHGHRVKGNDARGWHSEIFKRMYWSGSRAKFWGVSWHVNSIDYYGSALNAFNTASHLQQFLNWSVTGEITIAAHSLGNMVVSSVLSDYDITVPIRNYFLIDAAVASEAYDEAAEPTNDMVHPLWDKYSEKLWASEWFKLFINDQPTDYRSKLTWRNRFARRPASTMYYNFFSSGEDVLESHPHSNVPSFNDVWIIISEAGRQSWALQEKFKGLLKGGGWSFNLTDYGVAVVNNGQASIAPLPAEYANNIDVEQLRTKPFFAKRENDSLLFAEFTGSHYAMQPEVRNRLLVEAIPARTLAAGCQPILAFDKPGLIANFNMQMSFKNKNYWPKSIKSWQHNDFIKVAYPYVFPLYDTFAVSGGIK